MRDVRQAILDAALGLFRARGYEGAGVQLIADAAGVTKPTLYSYFGSKRGLLDDLLDEGFEPFLCRLARAVEHQDDLPLALNRVTRTFFEFADSDRQFYGLVLILASAPADSEAARAFADDAARWHEALVSLFAASSNPRVHGRAEQLAVTFLGMINTWIALALRSGLALDQDLAFQAVHQYMHGIYA